jgi:hypothetical protein
VITIGTRAFDRKFKCEQTSSEADGGTADQHFVPLFKELKAHMCSERPTIGPNSVTPKLISTVFKVSFPPHRKDTACILLYKKHGLNILQGNRNIH